MVGWVVSFVGIRRFLFKNFSGRVHLGDHSYLDRNAVPPHSMTHATIEDRNIFVDLFFRTQVLPSATK